MAVILPSSALTSALCASVSEMRPGIGSRLVGRQSQDHDLGGVAGEAGALVGRSVSDIANFVHGPADVETADVGFGARGLHGLAERRVGLAQGDLGHLEVRLVGELKDEAIGAEGLGVFEGERLGYVAFRKGAVELLLIEHRPLRAVV